MKFEYKGIHAIRRPIIDITIKNGKNITSALALIDSGADYSILDWELSDVLGLDLSNQKWTSFGGIKKEPQKAKVNSVT